MDSLKGRIIKDQGSPYLRDEFPTKLKKKAHEIFKPSSNLTLSFNGVLERTFLKEGF